MNFKINQLNEPIKCDKVKFPDFDALKYGEVAEGKGNSTVVFDATAFSESIGIDININAFIRTQKNYIDRLIQADIVKADRLFFIDKENHFYISTGMEILFLMFADKEYQVYFFELIEEVLTNGFAFSDGYVLKMTMERIPNETLQQVIAHRNEQK